MVTSDLNAEPSPQRHVVRGAAWLMALRWCTRLIGLASTVILARLLTPADFGIVAIAGIIVGSVEVFSQTGQFNAVVRHPNPTREHYDSVWTISLLLGLLLGLIIWAVAPWAAERFHEPRATLVVQVLALRSMMLGFQNAGIINFSRRLNFQRQFYFNVMPKLVSVLLTIGCAIVLRNYWALVIGILGLNVTRVVLSYMMDSFRPHIGVSKVREIWSFSIWSLVRSLGLYANSQIDKFAVAGFAGAPGMGRYQVARDLATSPSQELVTPVVNALMPVMAKVQGNPEKRRELYLSTLSWSALICSSTSVGVALVAEDLCDLVLGPKWHDAWPLMPWFALSWGVVGLTSGVSAVLLALGRAYTSAQQQWTRIVGYALAVFGAAYFFHTLEAVAIARFVMSLIVSPTIFVVMGSVLDIPMRDFVKAMWRPMAASAVMAAAVLMLNANIPFSGPARMSLDVGIGSIAYIAALMSLWAAAGRPPGLERTAWEYARVRLATP